MKNVKGSALRTASGMEKIPNPKTEKELIEILLHYVNSKEEYDFLLAELSALNSSHQELKGGADRNGIKN